LTLLIAVSAWPAAGAQPRWQDDEGREGGRGRSRAEGIREELKLTDAQEQQIGRLRLDHQKKVEGLRAQMREARFELRSIARAEKVDRAAAEKYVKAASDAGHQIKLAWLDHWIAVRALLTPDQQKIWKERFDGGPADFPGGRGRGKARLRGHGCGCDRR
jgi:Spy/CpxP family protein refolding chaperone